MLEGIGRLLGKEHPNTLTCDEQPGRDTPRAGRPGRSAASCRSRCWQARAASARRGAPGHAPRRWATWPRRCRRRATWPRQRALQTRVLEASGACSGKEHPDTLTAMGNLALTLQAQGDLAEAPICRRECWRQAGACSGRSTPTRSSTMYILVGACWGVGDLAGSRELPSRCGGARSPAGRGALGHADGDGNLAGTVRARSTYRAGDLETRALGHRRARPEHPNTLPAMINLRDDPGAGRLGRRAELQRRVLERSTTARENPRYFDRPGPEIIVYRLVDGRCSTRPGAPGLDDQHDRPEARAEQMPRGLFAKHRRLQDGRAEMPAIRAGLRLRHTATNRRSVAAPLNGSWPVTAAAAGSPA